MPPAYSDSEPESDHEEVIEPRNTDKGKDAAVYPHEPEDTDSIADEVVGDSAVGEGDDDDDGEEEYVVEKILGHSFGFPDEKLRYQTKWLGYDKKEDQTWEPQENLSGAVDILTAYHKSIGGTPKLHSKKRPRQSNGRSSIAGMERGESSESASKRLKAKPQKQTEGRGRKKNGTSPDEATVTPGDWKPPSPFPGSWDDLVLSIETIDCDTDGTKWAMVKWAEVNSQGSNRRSRSLLKTAHFACPQKMLTFYEQHLKFFERK